MTNFDFLIGQWIGNIYGTHPKNVFVQFNKTESQDILISLHCAESGSQYVSVFTGICNSREGCISVTLNESVEQQSGTINSTGNITFNICSENQLEGNFEYSNSIKGVIKISKFIFSNSIYNQTEPQQIIAKEYVINYPLKIYRRDIQKIIDLMRELATVSGKVVITEQIKGTKTSRYSKDYLNAGNLEDNIDGLSFSAQVMNSGFVNTITLNLNRDFSSTIISQSNNFLWSNSAPILLKEHLEKQGSKPLGFYRRYGLDINSLLFLTLLAILPSFEFKLRIAFVIGFLLFALAHKMINRWVSQTTIEQNLDKPSTFKERYPKLTYLFATALSAVLSIAIGYGVNMGIKHFFPSEKINATPVTITQELHRPQNQGIPIKL